VHSLWIGNKLPRLHQLAIRTWLVRGYDYRLFVWGEPPAGLSQDVTILDGANFMPEVYLYDWPEERRGHPALHANVFRYAWLTKHGGTWIDTDTMLLRDIPLDPVIFSSEPSKTMRGWTPNVAVVRVPPHSPVMEDCHQTAQRLLSYGNRTWGDFGPKLLKDALERAGMLSLAHVSPPHYYCPVPCWASELLYKPHALTIPLDAYCVHVWNTKSTERGFDADRVYDPESLYERLWRATA